MSLASLMFRRPYLLRPTSSITPYPQCSFSTSSITRKAPKSKGSVLTSKKTLESSCQAGQPMPKLAIFKDQPIPQAKKDDEYPSWLWTLLDRNKASDIVKEGKLVPEDGGPIDFVREKKRLRQMNKASIKAQNFLKST